MRHTVLLALLGIALASPAIAHAKKDKKGKGGSPKEQGIPDLEPFDTVIEGKEKIEGLFTFHRDPKTAQVWLELSPDQLERDFLLSAKNDGGVGEKGLYGTMMLESFVFRWRQFGTRIQMVRRNLTFRADDGSAEARAVAHSFSDSVVVSSGLASNPHPETGALLVDLGQLLVGGDFHGLGAVIGEIYEGGYDLDAENSGITDVRAFPDNVELEATTRFAGTPEAYSVALPDARAMQLVFRYSLLNLPDDGYRPRVSDDRIGYFTNQHLNFSIGGGDPPNVRWINRWRLEKKDPSAAISDPVEPITFWLENSVPEHYRPAMEEGVLLWNAAFEKAGFSNAVVVRQQPDDADWDPADVRYNTIRWFASYDASFAIGPSHTDPRTGEILDADIAFADGIIRYGALGAYRYWVDPIGAVRQMADRALDHDIDAEMCTYASELASEVSLAHDVLAVRGWTNQEEEALTHEYLREVTAHEVGHTLGLRHNFIASTRYTLDELFEGKVQATAESVMDYNPVLVAPKGRTQGPYLPAEVGAYDIWAIQYGYQPVPAAASPQDELEALAAIARRAPEPGLAYATDEDAGFAGKALDPRVTRFDFAADPLAFYAHQLALVRELRTRLPIAFADEGESYAVLRRGFDYGWRPYFSAAMVAAKHVGGVHHQRHHVGDPDGSLPFEPLSAAEQRRGLTFLADNIWKEGAYDIDPVLLQQLQSERHPDLEGSIWSADRIDYPIHEVVAEVQAAPLRVLLDGRRLSRLQDLEKMADGALTLEELFTTLRVTLWDELGGASTVDSHRRAVQRAHLAHLIAIVLGEQDAPGDAVSLARADLVALKGQMDRASVRMRDRTSRAHLQRMSAEIAAALEARHTR